MPDNKENLHAGHRGRMREKFELYGRDVFHTHELLEMLLFHAVKCKNTNPIAKNLLLRFSSLDGVLSATKEELMSVEGVGPRMADMILSIGKIDISESAEPFSRNAEHRFDDYYETGGFFVKYFAGKLTHETVILLLNNKMEYLSCESLYNLDCESAMVKAAPFIDAALGAHASIAVIAHNHPYGPAFPTPADKATNTMLADALEKSGVRLVEHYVVSGEQFVGFMNNIAAAFSQPYHNLKRFYSSKKNAR